MNRPNVQSFFHSPTHTFSHVVWDPATRIAAVFDSVLDYDAAAGRTGHVAADAIVAFVCEAELRIDWVIDTHVHADHLSAAAYVKALLGGTLAIGERVRDVQTALRPLFNQVVSGSSGPPVFDHLFADGEAYRIGNLDAVAWSTPGHTPACMTHVVGDAALVGDTLFMPDCGTARCDFPGGDARTLYRSIQRIFSLPGSTRLFLCHDYLVPGRDSFACETTVEAERRSNIHVHDGIDEDAFAQLRTARDATLAVPALILPSLQVNLRGGQLPAAEDNGTRYLKIPLDAW